MIKPNEQTLFGKHLLPSNTVSQIESKLEDLENDVQQYEQQVKCVELLQQKQAWLDYHAQNEHIKSWLSAIELLKKQKEETMARFFFGGGGGVHRLGN